MKNKKRRIWNEKLNENKRKIWNESYNRRLRRRNEKLLLKKGGKEAWWGRYDDIVDGVLQKHYETCGRLPCH